MNPLLTPLTPSSSRRRAICAACAVLALSSTAIRGFAQSAESPSAAGRVIGTGAVTSFVENMDRSLAFYHDAFGLDVPPLPPSGERPYNPSNAQLFSMFDIHGSRERHQSARLPDNPVRLEFMEIQDIDHSTIPLRLQDPGAMTLVFVVGDVAAMLERAGHADAEVVTPGGAPVRLADGSASVLLRDVDGRYVELREPATRGSAGSAGITDLRLSIAVADLERTLDAYRDVLGFEVDGVQSLGGDPGLRALTGLSDATFDRGTVIAPGSGLRIEFVDYGGVDRHPLSMRIQDRGAARLQLRSENLEPLVAAMRDAGMRVVSEGGGPVPIPPNFMGALVADPNNFFLTPFAPCDGCAPGLISERH